jgi:hypothetical protein
MKVVTHLFLLIILAAPLCLFGSSAAQFEFYSAAGASFPTLAVPVGVRAIGMGDAYTATGDDVYSLNWNPAGLAKISGYQLGLADNEWSTALGIRQDYISYGQVLGDHAGLGVSLNYFDLGQLDERDANTGALLGESNASVFAGTVGYGLSILSERIKLGVALEYADQDLYGSSLTDFDGTLGMVYDYNSRLSYGLSVNHIGTGAQGFNPPESVNLGVADTFFDRNLTIAIDAQLPFSSETMINAGFEYILSFLALRAGYRQAINAPDGDVQSGPTAGVGLKAGAFHLDYAYVPYGNLSTVGRVELTVELPSDFFKSQAVGPVASTITAREFYEEAVDSEYEGDTLQALIEYQRCVESYPDSAKRHPQDFYQTAIDKVKSLQIAMDKRGDTGQIAKLLRDALVRARDYMAKQEYTKAIQELEGAKKIDPTSQAMDPLIKDARRALEGRLVTFRAAAEAADKDDNLSLSVENYKKLVSLDPTDPEAIAFFTKHREDILAMLRDLHRKGIYEYVAGHLESAIRIWTNGQSLDYFGDVDFKRDIDKAQKAIDLRGSAPQ